ncbi:MAG: zinc-binding alcohol dehydrogenase/oxidoreductase [Gaiellales bacterium]|nr:zinc-binding alcohol dehydrogenase/oxidoreductase [Gaiellales bacterium]MDX6545668.1 zinc-binding alcohol dehydrogenase/oxidoreductase [Gaiellales bacterium]
MRAMRLVRPGDRPAFEPVDVAEPVAGDGDVVVRIVTAALNRRDWWIWREAPEGAPVTLGSDAAGVVAGVGAGVETVSVGDEVVINPTLGWNAGEHVPTETFEILGSPRDGTFADQVVVPAANVAPRPAGLSWEESAALNLAGLTAWRAVITCARAAEGSRVLVTGAGSGVATFAVQIAAAAGAEVWVTTSSDAKLQRLRELGARGGVLYSQPDWGSSLREAAGGGFDAVVDSWGADGWPDALVALRWGGVLVSFGDTGGENSTIPVSEVYWAWRSIVGTTMGSPEEYRALLGHVSMHAWRPVIDSVHALEDIDAAARRLLDRDRFGKIVLRVSDPS